MPSIAQLAQALQTVLVDQATAVTQAQHVIRRVRRLTGAQLIQILVGGWLADPDASYEALVAIAADLGVALTPQALAAHLTDATAAAVAQLLTHTMQQVMAADPAVMPLLDRFAAVQVQDTTVISLPDALAPAFAGCGGRPGQGRAAVKAHFRWELRTGRLEGPLLQDGRAADRSVEFVERPGVGTLRLRDLGFWHLDDLAQDAREDRFWIMRFKPGTAIFTADGVRHTLDDLLTALGPGTHDLAITLGVTHRIPCRLLIRPVDTAQAAARERRLERTASRKGRRVSAALRRLCAWEVLVTNVPPARLATDAVWTLYAVRWQIELLFKLWKQHGKLDCTRRTQPARVRIELYAKFIGLLLQHWMLLTGCWEAADRSLVKGARVVRRWAERLIRVVADAARLEHLLTALVAALQRTGRQTRRRKNPGTWARLGGAPTSLS